MCTFSFNYVLMTDNLKEESNLGEKFPKKLVTNTIDGLFVTATLQDIVAEKCIAIEKVLAENKRRISKMLACFVLLLRQPKKELRY